MRLDLKDISDRLPDFEDMLALADKIRETLLEKLLLEKEIKEKESSIYRTVMSDPNFFQGGKPPSVSFVESAYKHTGINGEMLPLRERMAELTATLDYLRMTREIYEDMLDVFRTISANERGL